MNAQRRQAAIEAGARALWAASLGRSGLDPAMLDRSWPTLASVSKESLRQGAAAVIDAAVPHLAGEPIGWIVVSEFGHVSTGLNVYATETEALRVRDFLASDLDTGGDYRVVALIPVEDAP